MHSRDLLLRALDLAPSFYAAVLHPGRWPETLAMLADFLEAPMARVAMMRKSDRHLYAGYGHGIDEHFQRLQLGRPDVYLKDPRLDKALERAGQPSHCREFLKTRTLRTSQFYRTYLEPFDIEYSMVLPLVYTDADFMMVVSVMRPRDGRVFAERDLQRYELLVGSLRQAGELASRLFQLSRDFGTMRALFDATVNPVILVDRFCNIVRANQSGLLLLENGAALKRHGRRLVSPDATINEQLHSAVLGVVSTAMIGQPGLVRHVALSPSDQQWGMQATICSLAPVLEGELPPAGWPVGVHCAAVFVNDPSRPVRMSEERLVQLFGLTRAEANILAEFAQGFTPAEIATRRERSEGTVRGQIKSIMGKTHCHRQFELVRLVLFSEPPVASI